MALGGGAMLFPIEIVLFLLKRDMKGWRSPEAAMWPCTSLHREVCSCTARPQARGLAWQHPQV